MYKCHVETYTLVTKNTSEMCLNSTVPFVQQDNMTKQLYIIYNLKNSDWDVLIELYPEMVQPPQGGDIGQVTALTLALSHTPC